MIGHMKDALSNFVFNLVPAILAGMKHAFQSSFRWVEERVNTIAEAITGKKLFSEEVYATPQMNPAGGGVTGLRGALHRQTGVGATLGTAAAAGGVTPGATSAGAPNQNFTKENAAAVRESAARLGTTPEELATVIGYETEGKFSPSIWGGAGGRYMGLIQFGPQEQRDYGANQNQTFKAQMAAVERYLKDRGFKPGMGLTDLYSTILHGKPGSPYARDINGSVSEHVARMRGAMAARANKFLQSGASPDQPGDSATPEERRATGGPVTAGRGYLVGERGPELFLPGMGGTMLPQAVLAALQALAASGAHSGFLPPNMGAAMAAGVVNNTSTVHNNSASNETHVGQLVVNTSAADASGIVRDIKPVLERTAFTMHANYSLA